MKVIDVHVHTGKWMFPIKSNSVAEIVEYMRLYDIEKSVVSSSSAITYNFIEGNANLARDLKRVDNLWGYIVLNPHYLKESLNELGKYASDPKFVGVKLHPEQQTFRLRWKNSKKLFERIADLHLPVLVHTFPDQVDDLCEVAREFPSVKIIMGHMGGNDWLGGIEKTADLENIFLEPCCSFPEADKIHAAVKAVGPERFVFGSDSTLLNPGFVLGMFADAELNEEERARIAYQNALQIFDFKENLSS